MCGRFNSPHLTQAQMLKIIEDFLEVPRLARIDEAAPPAVDSYNVKPTQQVQVQYLEREELVASTARWWFVPHWHKGDVRDWKATTFNARLDTAAEKPVFRAAWKSGRCLVPVAGYFEWTGPKGAKQPWLITLESNLPVLFLAGLWSVLADGTRTCTILTREAAPDLRAVHHRMPVILHPDQIEPWLGATVSDAEVLARYGTGWEGRFRTHEVAPFGLHADGPELLAAKAAGPPELGRLL